MRHPEYVCHHQQQRLLGIAARVPPQVRKGEIGAGKRSFFLLQQHAANEKRRPATPRTNGHSQCSRRTRRRLTTQGPMVTRSAAEENKRAIDHRMRAKNDHPRTESAKTTITMAHRCATTQDEREQRGYGKPPRKRKRRSSTVTGRRARARTRTRLATHRRASSTRWAARPRHVS